MRNPSRLLMLQAFEVFIWALATPCLSVIVPLGVYCVICVFKFYVALVDIIGSAVLSVPFLVAHKAAAVLSGAAAVLSEAAAVLSEAAAVLSEAAADALLPILEVVNWPLNQLLALGGKASRSACGSGGMLPEPWLIVSACAPVPKLSQGLAWQRLQAGRGCRRSMGRSSRLLLGRQQMARRCGVGGEGAGASGPWMAAAQAGAGGVQPLAASRQMYGAAAACF